MPIASVGSIQFSDQHADFYCGVRRSEDRSSFGVYQPVSFDDPATGLTLVAKPHSFWWSKADREFQVELQVFPFAPAGTRTVFEGEDANLIEVYATYGERIEVPASCLRDRLLGKLVFCPESVTECRIPTYVRNAAPEYPDSEEDSDPEEEEDEERSCSQFFYKYATDRSGALTPALPPRFNDAWTSFQSQLSSSRRFWKHEFTTMIYEDYVSEKLVALDASTPAQDIFHSIVTKSFVLVGPDSLRWRPSGPVVGGLSTGRLNAIAAFLEDVYTMHQNKAAVAEVWKAVCDFK